MELSFDEFRAKGIGSSEASCLIGKNPWMDIYSLYLLKIGKGVEKKQNFAMERGVNLEPAAREMFERIHGGEYPPRRFVHPTKDYIRCNADGFNEESGRIIEIKCPGAEDHRIAAQKEIPGKYLAQCEWLLIASGAKCLTYISFDGIEIVTVEYLSDPVLREKLLVSADWFWNECVLKKQPPNCDLFEDRSSDNELLTHLRNHDRIQSEIKKLEKELSCVKDAVKSLTKAAKTKVGDFYVSRSKRIGNVDYGAIPALESVNLDDYRKPAIEIITIRKEAIKL